MYNQTLIHGLICVLADGVSGLTRGRPLALRYNSTPSHLLDLDDTMAISCLVRTGEVALHFEAV